MPVKRHPAARTRVAIVVVVALVATATLLTLRFPHWFGARPYPGMPPVIDRTNVYSEAGRNRLSRATAGAPSRIYVPAIRSGDVTVIDPRTFQVVGRLRSGRNPQHVVPSWDLRTLWVTGSASPRRRNGSLTPIDPASATAGRPIPGPDAHNMYFPADGPAAIRVAEAP